MMMISADAAIDADYYEGRRCSARGGYAALASERIAAGDIARFAAPRCLGRAAPGEAAPARLSALPWRLKITRVSRLFCCATLNARRFLLAPPIRRFSLFIIAAILMRLRHYAAA